MDGSDPTPAVNDFFARYQETFGELPTSSLALLGYSTVEAFKIAAETANSLDGDKLAEALDSLGPLDILVGETEYDENTHFVLTRPMAIMQHQNGVKSLLEYRAVKTPPKLPF